MITDFFKILSLCLLLLVFILGLIWYRKKILSNFKNKSFAVMRQVGTLNIGIRERIVVVEVSNRWLVLGLTAGRMVALANIEKPIFPHTADEKSSDSYPPSFDAVVKNLDFKK